MSEEQAVTVAENADVETTPEAAPEAENTSTEDVVAETTDEPEAKEPETEPEKPKVDLKQRKIAKQARDNREMKRENARLMKMLETQTDNVSRMTKSDVEPKIEDFETMDAYLHARDDFKSSKKEPKAETAPQETQDYSARDDLIETGTDKYSDFEDVVFSQDVRISAGMADAIFEIDDLNLQADVAYFLGQNPKESAKIAKLSERRQIAEIAKLEMKVSKAPAKKRASKAPEPIKPVGGAKTTADGYVDGESYKSFLKKRNKELGR